MYDKFEFDRPLEAAMFETAIPEDAHVYDVNIPAPTEDTLLVEIRIKPADVGFVRVGQKANVKVSAYDYSLFGALDAAAGRRSDRADNEGRRPRPPRLSRTGPPPTVSG